jgi:bacterial/archaeal transporter family-2 protein
MTIPVFIAVGIGAAIAVQAATISSLADRVHPLTISLALLGSGLLMASIWASATRAWPDTLIVAMQWWWVPLGAVGWGIVAALGWTVARLGVALGLSLIVGAQLAAGLLIDLGRGQAVLGWRAAVGVVLLMAGEGLLGSAR